MASLLPLMLLLAAVAGPLSTAASHDFLIQRVTSQESIDDIIFNADHHFSIFKSNYAKTYESLAEHDLRLSIFKDNLQLAKRHQMLDPTAVHGVTKFSDLTPKEFRKNFLGLHGWRQKHRLPSDASIAPILPTNNLPKQFDWREKGAVTEVKDQGSCGSSWSFSTTGALEGAHFLATGELVSLSEQQLLDCDHECDPGEKHACDAGCKGGSMITAFEYLFKSGGIEREKDYPYSGHDGTCNFDNTKIVASVANFSVVLSNDNDQIAANLVRNGPLAVGVNDAYMQTYLRGVSNPNVFKKHSNHGMLLVGYGSADNAPISLEDKPFWMVKNSLGSSWGEAGYVKIARNRGFNSGYIASDVKV